MKRIAAAAVLAAVALAAVAQTTMVQVFTTVDAVKMDYTELFITGIQEGATAPSTVPLACETLSSSAWCTQQMENCERLALLAMAKPGQYVFEIEQYYYGDRCTLRRVAP